MTPWDHLKSFASLAVITLNLSLWIAPLLVAALLKLVVPGMRALIDRTMAWIYRAAVLVDDVWLRRIVGIHWDRPSLGLEPDETYVVLSNHVSWSDIFMIQSLLARDGPVLKFLVKRELIWVPLLGLIIWAFDFPILRRSAKGSGSDLLRRQRDLEALEAACRSVKGRPVALMSFAEGTRFAPSKRLARKSPYQHLLRPKSGGLFAMLDALDDQVDAVLDVTLVYDPPTSFWAFLSGGITDVTVHAERIPRAALPQSREGLEEWLGERWQEKDRRIAGTRGKGDGSGSAQADEGSTTPR